MRTVLAVIACASFTLAQDNPLEQVRRLLDEKGYLFKVEWKVDETGSLLQKPDPGVGANVHVFGPILGGPVPVSLAVLAGNMDTVGWWGSMQFLLLGNRDLASATRSAYHFEQLGYGLEWSDLRERMTRSVTGDDPLDRYADLERYLAVRLAERHGLRGLPDLVALARDENLDLLLRLAARDVAFRLASAAGRPLDLEVIRPPVVKLDVVLAAMPDAYDLVLTIDQRALPPMDTVSEEARRATALRIVDEIEAVGGTASPLMWAGAQLLSDRPGVLPFAVARLIGNCRIDRTTLAVAFDENGAPEYWVRLDGLFQVDRFRGHLVASGAEVKAVGSVFEVELEVRPGGPWANRSVLWELTFDGKHLEVRSSSYPTGDREKSKLVDAGWNDGAAIWLHLPPDSDLGIWEQLKPWGGVVRGLTSATVKVETTDGLSAWAELEFVGKHGEDALRGVSRLFSWMPVFRRQFAPWFLVWSGVEVEWGEGRAQLTWKPGTTSVRQWCDALSQAGVW